MVLDAVNASGSNTKIDVSETFRHLCDWPNRANIADVIIMWGTNNSFILVFGGEFLLNSSGLPNCLSQTTGFPMLV